MLQLGAVGPAMFDTGGMAQAPQSRQDDATGAMIATLVRTILSEMQSAEQRQRDNMKADQAEERARGASGIGGLLDSQRAGLAAERDPFRRATALGSMTHANRSRALKTAGIPDNAPFVTAMKADETEAEYIARMREAQAAHTAQKNKVRDKLRMQTAGDRAYKAATGKRGSGYVITADTTAESDPLNPLAPPQRKTTYNTTSMVERPLSRPPMKRDGWNSVDAPGYGSGAAPVQRSGYKSLPAARAAANEAIGIMGGGDPLNPAERTKVLNGPTDEEKLKQTLVNLMLGGGF